MVSRDCRNSTLIFKTQKKDRTFASKEPTGKVKKKKTISVI